MTETLAAPPLLRKQIDLGPPTFTIINKRLGGFTKFFCEAPEIFQAENETEKTENSKHKNRKQKLNRKPLLLLLLFLHLLCTINKTILARNFELKDRKKFRSSNNHKSFFSSSAPKHCNITKKTSLYTIL